MIVSLHCLLATKSEKKSAFKRTDVLSENHVQWLTETRTFATATGYISDGPSSQSNILESDAWV